MKDWVFSANDEATIEAWRRAGQKDARKAPLLSSSTIDGPPLTKHDHLYWDIADALNAYRQDMHGFLFPEYAWAHDHLC